MIRAGGRAAEPRGDSGDLGPRSHLVAWAAGGHGEGGAALPKTNHLALMRWERDLRPASLRVLGSAGLGWAWAVPGHRGFRMVGGAPEDWEAEAGGPYPRRNQAQDIRHLS